MGSASSPASERSCWRGDPAQRRPSTRRELTAPTPNRPSRPVTAREAHMTGIAIITEACIGTKDRACVDVCPVQCIYEFDSVNNILFSEVAAGEGVENTHTPN